MDPQVAFYLVSFLVFVIGGALGSFASALAYRYEHGMDWVAARSRCPSCGHVLGAADLVPFLSWLMSRGRCRHCGAGVSVSYLLLEVAAGFAALWAFWTWGIGAPFFCALVMIPVLLALFVIDCRTFLLPDPFVAVVAGLGVVYQAGPLLSGPVEWPGAAAGLGHVLLSACFFGGVLWLTGWLVKTALRKEALGFGDVKLAGAFGIWLPLSVLAPFLFLSGILGIVFGLVWRRGRGEAVFPFGPCLIASFWVCLMWGDSLSRMLTG